MPVFAPCLFRSWEEEKAALGAQIKALQAEAAATPSTRGGKPRSARTPATPASPGMLSDEADTQAAELAELRADLNEALEKEVRGACHTITALRVVTMRAVRRCHECSC